MIEVVTLILTIILLSRVSEELTTIPTTLFLISYSYISSILFDGFLSISTEQFNSILYIMIPIILLPDLLNLSLKEFRNNILPILYLAIISVLLSIALAVIIAPLIITEYILPLGAWVALFTMLMATDAITVSSIFSNFTLPSKLKIYAEGESLLNDVTALILFYFIALPMIKEVEITFAYVNLIIFSVIFKSIIIGGLSAYMGFALVKLLKDPIEQFIIIYLITIVAFLISEHLHVSGILAVITTVLLFKYLIDRELAKNPKLLYQHYQKSMDLAHNNGFYKVLMNIEKYIPAMTKKEFRGYKREAFFIGIFANGVVFIVMTHLFDMELLLKYSFEILAVFAITTLIRFSSIRAMFIFLQHPNYWSTALTLSGVKGALSIIMLNSIPENLSYKELFEAIVVGNVLLSTFVYTIILILLIRRNQERFKKDIIVATLPSQNYIMDIKNILEKESITGAYTKVFIDDILEKELSRAKRYKLDLSIIAFKVDRLDTLTYDQKEKLLSTIGQSVLKRIRINDYFGTLEEYTYIIITTNTPMSGANVLATRLKEYFIKQAQHYSSEISFEFGITQTTQTLSMLYENIYDALKRAEYSNKIEIEA
jgi:CPA1 family monovalent cation:H+ antiporter